MSGGQSTRRVVAQLFKQQQQQQIEGLSLWKGHRTVLSDWLLMWIHAGRPSIMIMKRFCSRHFWLFFFTHFIYLFYLSQMIRVNKFRSACVARATTTHRKGAECGMKMLAGVKVTFFQLDYFCEIFFFQHLKSSLSFWFLISTHFLSLNSTVNPSNLKLVVRFLIIFTITCARDLTLCLPIQPAGPITGGRLLIASLWNFFL